MPFLRMGFAKMTLTLNNAVMMALIAVPHLVIGTIAFNAFAKVRLCAY